MRLLLFALLCALTLWIIRRLKAQRRPPSRPRERASDLVPPDQIIDVTYEDCSPSRQPKEGD